MGGLTVEVRREVDDLHGFEGTLFHADAAADAKFLGNLRDLRGGGDFDAQFAGDLARGAGTHADDGARPLALLPALLRLTSVGADDGDPRHLVRLLVVFPPSGFRHFRRLRRWRRRWLWSCFFPAHCLRESP